MHLPLANFIFIGFIVSMLTKINQYSYNIQPKCNNSIHFYGLKNKSTKSMFVFDLDGTLATASSEQMQDIMVKATNEHGKPFVMEVKGGNLLARAIQHENDHLDGILFIDHCLNRFEAEEVLKKYNLPSIDPDKLIDEEEMKSQL